MGKFEEIQTKSFFLGVHIDDNGWKIAIEDKHHLIGQSNFNNSNHFSFTRFLYLV